MTADDHTGAGYLNRGSAANYLSSAVGRKVSVGSLHRMASDGTGPRYVMLLGHASYRREWLDEWVAASVQQPKKRPRKGKALTPATTSPAEAKQSAASTANVAA